MSCKKCRHWFVNPNIVIPGEPTEGKCLVSEIKTQSNQVCNAWELSQIAEWKDENERLKEELRHEKTRSQLNLEAEERRMLNITHYCAEIDRLNARVAELEHDLTNKEIEYTDLWDDALTLQSRIAELEAAQRWIPVSERLPDDDVEVFVLLYGSSVSTGKHYRNARHLDLEDNSYDLNYVIGDCWLIGDDEITCAQHCYNAVTHWIPLPEPPNDTQTDTFVYGKDSKPIPCPFCGEIMRSVRDE